MTKKEKFMLFIYLGAIAGDVAQQTADAPMIAHCANRIEDDAIPENPVNAAKVYLSYVNGRSTAFKWMRNGRRQ